MNVRKEWLHKGKLIWGHYRPRPTKPSFLVECMAADKRETLVSSVPSNGTNISFSNPIIKLLVFKFIWTTTVWNENHSNQFKSTAY